MSVPAERVEWNCPGCGKRYAIPAHVPEPKLCPQCRKRSVSLSDIVAAEYPLPAAPAPMGFPIDVEPAEFHIDVPEFEPDTPLPLRRAKYPALRIIALCYKVLAGIAVLGAVVGFGISITATATAEPSPERTFQIIAGLVGLGGGAILAVSLWAFGELIQVQLDIEENTRRAAKTD